MNTRLRASWALALLVLASAGPSPAATPQDHLPDFGVPPGFRREELVHPAGYMTSYPVPDPAARLSVESRERLRRLFIAAYAACELRQHQDFPMLTTTPIYRLFRTNWPNLTLPEVESGHVVFFADVARALVDFSGVVPIPVGRRFQDLPPGKARATLDELLVEGPGAVYLLMNELGDCSAPIVRGSLPVGVCSGDLALAVLVDPFTDPKGARTISGLEWAAAVSATASNQCREEALRDFLRTNERRTIRQECFNLAWKYHDRFFWDNGDRCMRVRRTPLPTP